MNARKSIKVAACFLILVWLTVGALETFAQMREKPDPLKIFDEHKRWYTGFTEAWFNFSGIPEADVRNSIAHWEAIGKDLTNPNGSLTKGSYYSGGETHGSYLRWSQEKGFIWLHVDHCQGGPTRIIRGQVNPRIEGVVLVPEITLGHSSSHGGHPNEAKEFRFIAIKWMGATYLVQKENLADFADFSAGLGDYNSYYLFHFGEPFLVTGLAEAEMGSRNYAPPIYPREYESFHKPPIRGQITSIEKGRRQIDAESDTYDRLVTMIQVKLDGSARFALPIKLLPIGEKPGFEEEFAVRSIKGNIATIEHIRLTVKRDCASHTPEDCKDPEYLKPRVGMVLSSNGL